MKLSKIELFGFKSFADRTVLTFDEGVTCVVGPNGCGKSNISDAIRWVLGERSAKLLRGSKMEDVIFNGTDFRKALALAEVSLTIDNQDRGLAIDYNEVTITRRLYRSGESEYLVNKTVCRLKDIQDLILDTGIGSNSYSMIEQGRIDYILNADADERRFLIEEAAGISKYKVKKEEAIRKLERTEENRLRLNDIVQEVTRNIQYAERQAKRASRYQELFEKLRVLEIKKAFHDQAKLAQERKAVEDEQAALKTDFEGQESALHELRAHQETVARALEEIASRYGEQDTIRHQVQSKLEQVEQSLAFHREQRADMANRRSQIAREDAQTREQIERNRVDIGNKQAEYDGFANEKNKACGSFQAAESDLKAAEDKLRQAKQHLESVKSESLEAAGELSKIRNEYHRISVFLDTRAEQKRHKQANAKRLQQEAETWQHKQRSTAEEAAVLSAKLTELKIRKEGLAARSAELESLLAQKENSLRDLDRELRELETQHQMLCEMEKSSADDAQLHDDGDAERLRENITTLREIIRVRDGFEWALDAVLDSYARSWILDDVTAAESAIGKMKRSRPAALGLLLNHPEGVSTGYPEPLPPLEHPRVLCALTDVIEVDERYRDLLEPFIADTYLLEPATSTEELIRELLPLALEYRLVSEEGFVLGPYGMVLFQNRHHAHAQANFQRRGEMDRKRTRIQELSGRVDTLQEEIRAVSAEKDDLMRHKEGLETEILDATIQKESYDSLHHGMEDRLGSYQRELDLIGMETRQMIEMEEDAIAQKNSLESAVRAAEEREKIVQLRQQDILQQIETLDQARSDALRIFAEAKVRWEGVEEKSRLLEGSLAVLKESDQRDRKRIEALAEENISLDAKEKQLEADDIRLRQESVEYESLRGQTEISLGAIREQKQATEQVLAETLKRLEETRSAHQRAQSGIHDFEMKLMDLGFQEKAVVERLLQTYRLRLTDFDPAEYVLEAEEQVGLEETLTELRSKVENIGTVNLLAIEEFDELKKRHEFLLAQQKDLEDAKEQLMETIRKINRTTKGLFEETFRNVQVAFEAYYQILFQGGYARLVLVDESNPLESGIDIVVRPPAKKPTHITLLSGGEKALTAIALLFALFKIKPSPFCVLDEVDAPLDEANIDRFLTVLREFLHQSQFIIVTHNRKTIAMGDSLFGVTMQEPGVSKIVSVRVNALEHGPAPKTAGAGEAEMTIDELVPLKSGAPEN